MEATATDFGSMRTGRGSVLGRRYRLHAQIGEGSFSEVYLAHDLKAENQSVAVKVLKNLDMEGSDWIRRFQREIQLTQQLDHPNIVRIFSSGLAEDGQPYFVTEYFPYGDLLQEIEPVAGKGLPFLRAVNLIRFVGRGLAHAHKQKILHRDIKPENILLTSSRNIKISDFGIGLSLLSPRLTPKAAALGTPHYMAPEQIECGELGPWTDVYSLGVLSFLLLTGKLPFTGEDMTKLVYQKCFAPLPPLILKGAGIPCWMEDIVYRACDKNPSQRFQTADAMVELIEKYHKEDRAQASFPARIFFTIRPNGKACTFLTEKGVSRKKLKIIFFSVLAAIVLCLYLAFWR